jgi:hypothetical protein
LSRRGPSELRGIGDNEAGELGIGRVVVVGGLVLALSVCSTTKID